MTQYIARIVRPKTVTEQVEEHVRNMIIGEQWPAGTKLPASRDLAQQLGTSTFTIQTALERLCREGLLERRQRLGTYVSGATTKLTCVGLYFGGNFFEDEELGFHRAIFRELRKRYEEKGIKTRFWVDDRHVADQSEPYVPLRRSIERREIQAVISPTMVNRDNLKWLTKLKIPTAFGTSAPIPNRITSDWRQMLAVGLQSLKERGCSTVGLITHHQIPEHVEEGRSTPESGEFYNAFFDLIKELKLEAKSEWICTPKSPSEYIHFEEFGYNKFEQLWSQPGKPQGLLVYPDMAAKGVLTAILKHRVRVPQDLKLAFHRSDLVPYLCPVPAVHMVGSVADAANALMEIIHTQLNGESAAPYFQQFVAKETL